MLSSSACCTLLAALISAAFFAAANPPTVKQCLCSEIQPCSEKYMNTWKTCMQQCKGHFSSVGGDVEKLGHCLDSNQALLQSTIRCTQSHGEDSEINRMINGMGLEGAMKGLMDAGKKAFGCTRKCMNTKAGNCEKTLKCGLDFPPDNVAVQEVKKCALNSGLNTANAQAMCKCAAAAGVKNLTPAICAKVKVT
ncbi:hypothetical protein niasHS_014202 [Heterodera schachtii]|uniref:Uncharacterized protein n=1 Tax=Heterodera schachtii TaxID=97005 RepID=A0ABD2I6R5_HETSC